MTTIQDSSFFTADRLTSKTAEEVVKKLKGHLPRHGIPDQLVLDNGQPFSSTEFQEFANIYGFEHVTSSPTYAQSKRKAESAVKTAKSLLEKVAKPEQDPYLLNLTGGTLLLKHLNHHLFSNCSVEEQRPYCPPRTSCLNLSYLGRLIKS